MGADDESKALYALLGLAALLYLAVWLAERPEINPEMPEPAPVEGERVSGGVAVVTSASTLRLIHGWRLQG